MMLLPFETNVPVASTDAAVPLLPAMIELRIAAVAVVACMPPPLLVDVFPAMVELVTVRAAPLK